MADVALSGQLVFVQSTGRCGSTLVSDALGAADGVVSLSEPDVYYQLHQLRDQDDPEAAELVSSCTKVLCAPRPASTWAIKFRSMNIELSDLLLRAFPKAKTVFLYRDAISWARSAARAFHIFDPTIPANWEYFDDILPPVASLVTGPSPYQFPTPCLGLAWVWSTSMVRAIAMADQAVAGSPPATRISRLTRLRS